MNTAITLSDNEVSELANLVEDLRAFEHARSRLAPIASNDVAAPVQKRIDRIMERFPVIVDTMLDRLEGIAAA
ncbi:hypothetical protein [Paraburkholderia sediminicola]|uniref:hypothetical protein n=1 Tax=Paraburkholderia sediminicola TaxID=458836 RepID=UPI0038BBC220